MILRCFGNIAYWSYLVKKESVVLELNHTFQKQSDLSQYDIVTAQGILKLSVPTQKNTRKGLYEQVHIDYNSAWQVEHWRSIENAYRKSPFFLYYGYKIERVFMKKHLTLLEFNLAIFEALHQCIKTTSTWEIDNTAQIYYTKIEALKSPVYPQVFDAQIPFQENVCILDLLFNLGPETKDYLLSM